MEPGEGRVRPFSPQGRTEKAPLAGTGKRLSGEASSSIPSSALLGRTLVEDPQGLFKKYREEELKDKDAVLVSLAPTG